MIQDTRRAGLAVLALATLAGCGGRPLDMDLRDLGEGFSTTDAAMGAAVAPDPTLAAAAPATAPLPAPLPAAGPVTTTALAPVGPVVTAPLAPLPPTSSAPVVTAASSANVGAARHAVVRGETAYSIARLYGVSVSDLAAANALGPDLAIREGQSLAIPAGAGAPATTTRPGQGSPTPVPPSASAPLPDADEAPAARTPAPAPVPQGMASQQTAPASGGQLGMPVQGSIIRAYAPGRNEGIDIGASAGAEVRAAEAGTVAAVTTNTDGVQIVVIRHAGDLLTVYTHLEASVAKDARVARGQAIGRVRAGDPAFLHFEVRRGMESQDPADFLP